MTPAGTSNELDVQNGWEENTHTHISCRESIKVIMSFDLTSRNKDYKSLDKRWVMGLMGQMSFTLMIREEL